jgi:hypothetical protein
MFEEFNAVPRSKATMLILQVLHLCHAKGAALWFPPFYQIRPFICEFAKNLQIFLYLFFTPTLYRFRVTKGNAR